MNLQELFEVDLNQKLEAEPELLRDSKEVFQLEIDNQCWHIDFLDSRQVKPGKHPQPDCSIQMSLADLEKLMEGSLNVPMAVAMRKIKISGNLKLIPKLVKLFR